MQDVLDSAAGAENEGDEVTGSSEVSRLDPAKPRPVALVGMLVVYVGWLLFLGWLAMQITSG